MRIFLYGLALVIVFQAFPLTCMAESRTINAPVECLDTARSLISYLLNEKTDISKDRAAQSRWLSAELRSDLETKRKASEEDFKRNPTDKIDWPDNRDFFLTWEPPSTATILGSRRYGDIAFVDFEFKWGKGKNYEGNTRIQSYIFILRNGKWKLDDVYHVREPFAWPANLSSMLSPVGAYRKE